MTRALWIVVALAACGKKSDPNAGAGSGGSAQNGPAATNEPKTPPPPPTIKQGKGDCKTEYAPRPTRDPNPMCKVAGGTLEMVDFKDKMTVKLSPYLIDQFEVTNAQVAHYLNATKAENCSAPNTERDPCFRIGKGTEADRHNGKFVVKKPDGSYGVMPGFERMPFDRVSRQGAVEYCAWAGKTLPTEPQWEFAARRDPATNKDYLYPWGDEFDGKRARCTIDICPAAPRGDPKTPPRSNQPAPVGSFDGTGEFGDGRSPWGLFDMAGNAGEVIADCDYAYKPCNAGPCIDPPPHPPSDGRCDGIVRGGRMEGERQLRTINRGRTLDGGQGFRCAKPAG